MTPAVNRSRLRTYATHKEFHLAANLPQVEQFSYNDQTLFRREQRVSSAAEALSEGTWVQIHPPRRQHILVRSQGSQFDPAELPPYEEGRRGFANDLTCAAVLGPCRSKRPAGVIDIPVEITAERTRNGKTEQVTLNAKSTTFVLDGKPAPVQIAARAGRRAVLCHYRNQQTPHKVFVQSRDGARRGVIEKVDDQGVFVVVRSEDAAGRAEVFIIKLEQDCSFQLDGRTTTPGAALKPGREITILPRRARTVRSFSPDGSVGH